MRFLIYMEPYFQELCMRIELYSIQFLHHKTFPQVCISFLDVNSGLSKLSGHGCKTKLAYSETSLEVSMLLLFTDLKHLAAQANTVSKHFLKQINDNHEYWSTMFRLLKSIYASFIELKNDKFRLNFEQKIQFLCLFLVRPLCERAVTLLVTITGSFLIFLAFLFESSRDLERQQQRRNFFQCSFFLFLGIVIAGWCGKFA